MSPQYAANTSVPTETSRAEIERTLRRYGATSFASGWDQSKALIEFAADGRRVRFVLPLPDRADPAFATKIAQHSHKVVPASADERERKWEQACRQSWRALALVVKAKLEAVEAGISEFEDEFLAHIVLPDGSTAGQWLRPQIHRAYETGTMPPMLALGEWIVTTFDDDFIRLNLGIGPANMPCVRAQLEWPPPEHLYLDTGGNVRVPIEGDNDLFVMVRTNYSQITDQQRAGMTHVCRGAEYSYERLARDATHHFAFEQSFLHYGVTPSCSCGWTGERTADVAGAEVAWEEHVEVGAS